jgi:hypothetical protein
MPSVDQRIHASNVHERSKPQVRLLRHHSKPHRCLHRRSRVLLLRFASFLTFFESISFTMHRSDGRDPPSSMDLQTVFVMNLFSSICAPTLSDAYNMHPPSNVLSTNPTRVHIPQRLPQAVWWVVSPTKSRDPTPNPSPSSCQFCCRRSRVSCLHVRTHTPHPSLVHVMHPCIN